jgi:Arylsulfotransferase (ASST)
LNPKITRRKFLQAAAAGGVAWVALGGTLGCDPAPRVRATAASAPAGRANSFRSRPDLHPPVIEVTTQARDTAPGYIFVAPKNGPDEAGPGQDGCMILDNDGQPVWLNLLRNEYFDVMDFKAQTYKGEKVITWWVGHHTGYGQGEYIIADSSYRQIKRLVAGNGLEGDHHEFLITPQDTALITIYNKVEMDLSSVGGPVEGTVLDGIVQELDIESGEVIFEWHSLEHVEISEPRIRPYDHLHTNSIDVFDKDHLIISSRAKSTIFKLDRKTGEVVWRLGGEESDFEMGPGTRFALQHDARPHPDGTITIFDNGSPRTVEQSRGIVVEVDEDAMKATLVREYTHPEKLFSATQGSLQVLPNGNVFVGWGSSPVISEFSPDGELLFSASFPIEGETYRAFRFPWKGFPEDSPAIAAESGEGDEVTLYASWNGATEVATWQVLAGRGPEELEPIGSAPRKGFETVITANTTEPYVGLQAKDASDKVLGTTRAIEPKNS